MKENGPLAEGVAGRAVGVMLPVAEEGENRTGNNGSQSTDPEIVGLFSCCVPSVTACNGGGNENGLHRWRPPESWW